MVVVAFVVVEKPAKKLVVEAFVAKKLVVVAEVVVERSKKAPPLTSSLEFSVVVEVSPIMTPMVDPPAG